MSKNKKVGKKRNPNRPRSKNNAVGKRNGPKWAEYNRGRWAECSFALTRGGQPGAARA